LATDYIFRGQLGGREKNEEGKRKERKYNSILQHYTQLYGIVYYIYPPFNVTFNIQQLPSVEDILDELQGAIIHSTTIWDIV
jgi:hypothetical protein